MKINKNKLGIAMASTGLTFKELAKIANVSRPTLSYINNGKECRPDIAYKIAKALNINVTDIVE